MGRWSLTSLSRLALASAIVLGCAGTALPQARLGAFDDPVELLSLALKEDRTVPELPPASTGKKFEEIKQHRDNILDFRRKNLNEKAEALKSLSELRRAVLLPDWDFPTSKDVMVIDQEVRKQIAERFRKAIRLEVEKGDRERRMTVARMIADIPPTFRNPGGNDQDSFTRTFTDDILKLSELPDKGVVIQALNALGSINAEPAKAAARFRAALKDERADVRLLAAQGLTRMMDVVVSMKKVDSSKAVTTREDVLLTAQEVVPICLLVLKDPNFDWRVRAACLDTIRQSARGLEGIVEAFPKNEDILKKDVPPGGRRLSNREVNDLAMLYEKLRTEFKQVDPYFRVLRDAAPCLVTSLSDANVAIRLKAIETLSTIASSRYTRANRLAILPLDRETAEKFRANKGLIEIEDPLEEVLHQSFPQVMKLREDSDMLVRQRFFEFLELLEMDALPTAVPALLEGLECTMTVKEDERSRRADPNNVISLIAARTWKTLVQLEGLKRAADRNPRLLRPRPPRLSDEQIAAAVPGLAKLLGHPGLDWRREAAKALEAMGSLAGGARVQLAAAIRNGDAGSRLMMFPVIARLAAEDAQTLVPDLVKYNLSHDDWHVREAAAKTLGRIGAPARSAVPALRRVGLGDEVEEVRIAACDAVTSILPAPQ